jgi:hypothetical protein
MDPLVTLIRPRTRRAGLDGAFMTKRQSSAGTLIGKEIGLQPAGLMMLNVQTGSDPCVGLHITPVSHIPTVVAEQADED